jgi:hypothetical protein
MIAKSDLMSIKSLQTIINVTIQGRTSFFTLVALVHIPTVAKGETIHLQVTKLPFTLIKDGKEEKGAAKRRSTLHIQNLRHRSEQKLTGNSNTMAQQHKWSGT